MDAEFMRRRRLWCARSISPLWSMTMN